MQGVGPIGDGTMAFFFGDNLQKPTEKKTLRFGKLTMTETFLHLLRIVKIVAWQMEDGGWKWPFGFVVFDDRRKYETRYFRNINRYVFLNDIL